MHNEEIPECPRCGSDKKRIDKFGPFTYSNPSPTWGWIFDGNKYYEYIIVCESCKYKFHRKSYSLDYAILDWNNSPLRKETKLTGKCPLCYMEKAVVVPQTDYHNNRFRIMCKSCGMSSGKYKTEDEAILAWANMNGCIKNG